MHASCYRSVHRQVAKETITHFASGCGPPSKMWPKKPLNVHAPMPHPLSVTVWASVFCHFVWRIPIMMGAEVSALPLHAVLLKMSERRLRYASFNICQASLVPKVPYERVSGFALP